MKTKFRFLSLIGILMITVLACGQLNFGVEESAQQAENSIEEVTNSPTPQTEPQTESQPDKTAVRDDSEKEDYSEYWRVVEDYRTGLRFAIPCFWVADIPSQQDNFAGLGSFSVNNFTQDFIASLGPKRSQTVFEIGGMKFDLSYFTMEEFNLSPNSTLEELAYRLVNPDAEHGIDSTAYLEVNGKQALRVNSWSNFGKGSFYLIPFTNNLIILFGPGEYADSPDIQAIMHSMALDPGSQVKMPTHKPADPPEGMDAPCIRDLMSAELPPADESALIGALDCGQVTESEDLMWIMCNVQDSFRSRNTQPLLSLMGEPFRIGYWQSEGVELSREQAFTEITQNYLPDDPTKMVFTLDRALFPPLFGMPPEQIFSPDAGIVSVIYSEGWGLSGDGAALLYFAQNSGGGYYFYGMVIALGHFDK